MGAAEDHEKLAAAKLHTSSHHTDSGDPADILIATHTALQGIGYALLALVPLVREIGDQLDALPATLRCGETGRGGQRCIRPLGHDGKHAAGNGDLIEVPA